MRKTVKAECVFSSDTVEYRSPIFIVTTYRKGALRNVIRASGTKLKIDRASRAMLSNCNTRRN